MSSAGFVPAAAPRRAVDLTPLALPAVPPSPPRPGVPWLASAVPIVGALGFWAVTGSAFALWFAMLGPVIAVAGVVDGARTARRARRTAMADAESGRERVRARLDERQDDERARLRAQHPDVAGYLAHPDQIWRPVAERARTLVVGVGPVPSAVRVSGGDDDPGDADLHRRALTLEDAPVVVPGSSGIAVVGPAVAARATARAIVLQLALARPPGELAIVVGGDQEWAWARRLPHATTPAPTTLALGLAGEPIAAGDLVLLRALPNEPLPPRCDVVVSLLDAAAARVEVGSETHSVTVEAVGEAQAQIIADELAVRAASAAPPGGAVEEPQVALAELIPTARRASSSGLAVSVGRCGGAAVTVDIVRDGPHALVTGMTGAGKSELLVTWVVALCATYDTAAVSFLLADFKGGTAFDALAGLPHVTGVITDLDTRVARRAIESLRAEIRHREALIAGAGARDITRVDIPRLVIVVDEFAALRDTHPELETLFIDIAARGRALGMHLIIGTQRAAGVVRDGLLANCPLRISLRVADPYDSRAVVGTEEAAALPGGPPGHGLAILRRAADARTTRMRVALSSAADVARARSATGPEPRRPWLPALGTRIDLAEVDDGEPGLLLGLVDEPAHQRQRAWRLRSDDRGLLVVGGAGSGKSTALRTLAAQVPAAAQVRVGPEPEAAWDALMRLSREQPRRGSVVFIDDLDALATRLPGEYGRLAADAAERLIRGAGDLGIQVVVSAQRLTGVAARLAELIPRRLVLGTPSRAEHVAAGGDAADHLPDAPPGRGVIDRHALQVALGDAPGPAAAVTAPPWDPPPGVSGFVVRHAPTDLLTRWERTGVRLRAVGSDDPAAAEPDGRVVMLGDPEQWLARPRLLAQVRATSSLVIDASCAADYRMLTGDRDLPPYAEHSRGRAWVCGPSSPPRRVALRGA